MSKIEPLKQNQIKDSIKLMNNQYEDSDKGAIILRDELYKLRFSTNMLTEEQCKDISRMISFKLKPLALVGEYSDDKGIKYIANGLYSVLRGYRGDLRAQLAWQTAFADMNKLRLTFAAANDHKKAADKVTNRENYTNFIFYQRKKSSKEFHEAFKLLYKKPSHWEEYSKRSLFFNHEESYWNNKALFSILRRFVYNPNKIPNYQTIDGINILIGQTALYLTNNTTYLAINSTNEEKQITFFQEQIKYGQKAREIATTYQNIEAHLLKKELQAEIELHKLGIEKNKETELKAKKLINIINSMKADEKDKFGNHQKTAIKVLYYLE